MMLSKSLYTKGIQCPKALWLKKHKQEVLTSPDESVKAIFATGKEVEALAYQLFPNGKEIKYEQATSKMIASTRNYLDIKVPIYQATFEYQGILVIIDILTVEDDGVSLYEVKSATSIKDIYLHDLSIQHYVLKSLGFTIKSSNLIYINNDYIKKHHLEIEKLFIIEKLNDQVEALQLDIPTRLKYFKKHLADKHNEPDIDVGKHCHKPYKCDAKHYCWQQQRKIPEYSIFNIFNLGSKKQRELYSQGIINIEDIPDDFDMTDNQAREVKNYKLKTTFIDKERIQAFCDELTYPIYHLDFETFQQAMPKFNGISPFEQIPFQYSLHIEYKDGTLEHKEFLAQEDKDPREKIAKKLVEDIPINVTVLAYNMSFEKSVIKRLASDYGKYASHLLNINKNLKDLMIPFRNQWYATPNMKGSYSIKYVLPALVPEFAEAYNNLDLIHNGDEAMNAYSNLGKLAESEKQRVKNALLEYCKLDTLAMVYILREIKLHAYKHITPPPQTPENP